MSRCACVRRRPQPQRALSGTRPESHSPTYTQANDVVGMHQGRVGNSSLQRASTQGYRSPPRAVWRALHAPPRRERPRRTAAVAWRPTAVAVAAATPAAAVHPPRPLRPPRPRASFTLPRQRRHRRLELGRAATIAMKGDGGPRELHSDDGGPRLARQRWRWEATAHEQKKLAPTTGSVLSR